MASICWVAQCRTVRGGNSLKGAEVTSNRTQSSTRTREWRNKLHGAQPHYADFSRKLRFWRTFKSKDDSALRAGYSSRFGLCLACMRMACCVQLAGWALPSMHMACCVQFKGWASPSSTWPWIPNLAPPLPPPQFAATNEEAEGEVPCWVQGTTGGEKGGEAKAPAQGDSRHQGSTEICGREGFITPPLR